MESVAIEVYGRLAGSDQDALRLAVACAFDRFSTSTSSSEPASVKFFNSVAGEPVLAENVGRPFIVRVCVLCDETASWQNIRSFLAIINHSPHVPVVFVELSAQRSPRSHVGGVTWAVHEPGDWATIAESIRRAVETSWWRVISTADLPGVIVDGGGQIAEANRAARALYKDDLVGRSYLAAIEGQHDSAELPPSHPIREALGPEDLRPDERSPLTGVSRYRHVLSPTDQVIHRAQLVCIPLTYFMRKVTSAAVFLFDLGIIDQIHNSARAFALAPDIPALLEAIVRQVREMGYRRARLYEYDRASEQLFGRSSVGFLREDRREEFRKRVIPMTEDNESHNTIIEARPSLFIYDERERTEPESDLVHYCRRGNDAEAPRKGM